MTPETPENHKEPITMLEDYRNAAGRMFVAAAGLGLATWPIFLEELRPYGVITIPLGILFFAIAYKMPTEEEIAQRKACQETEKAQVAKSEKMTP